MRPPRQRFDGADGHGIGVALGREDAPALRFEGVVVVLKAAVQPAQPGLQGPIALHAEGVVAGGPQQRGHGGHVVGQAQAIAGDTRAARHAAGQHAGHAWPGQRHFADGIGIDPRFIGECIQRGGEPRGAAVGAQPIGAQRVDAEQQNIGRRLGRGQAGRRQEE